MACIDWAPLTFLEIAQSTVWVSRLDYAVDGGKAYEYKYILTSVLALMFLNFLVVAMLY